MAKLAGGTVASVIDLALDHERTADTRTSRCLGSGAAALPAGGRAAITNRKVGRGRAVYIGTYLTEALVEGLADQLFAHTGIAPLIADLPANVEVTVREAADRKLLFVLNTDEGRVEVSSLPTGVDLLTGKEVNGCLSLGPHESVVIRF